MSIWWFVLLVIVVAVLSVVWFAYILHIGGTSVWPLRSGYWPRHRASRSERRGA